MRRWRVWFLGLALGVACAGSGKGGTEDPVVARVGPRLVTKSFYESRLAIVEREFLPDTLDLAGKRQFLDLIITKEVLDLKAAELGFGTDPHVLAAVRSAEEKRILEMAQERALQAAPPVTETDVRWLYDRSHQDVLVKQILLETRDEAQQVVAELGRGGDFDSLVQAVSKVPRIAADGNEVGLEQRARLGWIEAGSYSSAFERAAYDTPLGKVSEPVPSPYGWHVFLPVETRPHPMGSFAEERGTLESKIADRRGYEAANDYRDAILRDHGFQIDLNALNIASGRLPEDPASRDEVALQAVKRVEFTEAEARRFFFAVDGRHYSLGDFADFYGRTPMLDRPQKWLGTGGVYSFIRDVWMRPLQVERARRDGVDQDPAVVEETRRLRELLMVGRLHDKFIGEVVPEPTAAEVERFYAEHPQAYRVPEQRACNLIVDAAEEAVRAAHAKIRAGASFTMTALQMQGEKAKLEDVQTIPFSRGDPAFREVEEQAFSLPLAGISEPFETSFGWVLLQVREILPERRLPLDEVYGKVVQDWKSAWSEARIQELVAEWKKTIPIHIDEGVLASTRVPRGDVFVPSE